MSFFIRSNLAQHRFSLATIILVSLSLIVPTLHPTQAHAQTTGRQHFASRGELDCNGYSALQQPIKRDFFCADITGLHGERDRKSTRLNSSHVSISYAVF